ncbi:MAG TPA: hypothetical protein DCG79_02490 [Clostridiales bacterium]|nr:hypothetical protein [Clostridiales bacterium]
MEKHLSAYSTKQNKGHAEHFVEDARSAPARQVRDKKGKRRLAKGKTILLTAAITLLCFSLSIVAADLIGGGSLSAYTAVFQRKSKTLAYYAVYATHSQDMSVSYKNAAAVREQGAAGYVLKENGEYYVVLNVYDEKSAAEKVSERSKNYGVLKIEFPPFDSKKNPSLAAAEQTKDLYKEAHAALYDAANDLSAGKYQKDDMLRSIRSYKQKVIAAESAYAEKIRGAEDTARIEYKVILAEIKSAFENLENSNHLVSDARYYAVMIIRSYALFAQKYFS